MNTGYKHVYGPVPSRRLGRSLGVDTMPFKTCTFDCVYCQLGRTTNKTAERKHYVPVDEILAEVRRKLSEERPDYISFAGSGEPTLHAGLGEIIAGIKAMTDIPVVVLTNGSLLWMPEVQDALLQADVVIPSLDGGNDAVYQRVNRPESSLSFANVVKGLIDFRKRYTGQMWLEVFFLGGDDTPENAEGLAALVQQIQPNKVQINTVCRPPAESFATSVPYERLLALQDLFSGDVEIIAEHRDDAAHMAFKATIHDADVLALIERRPCTASGVAVGLGVHVTEAIKHLDRLVAEEKAVILLNEGQTFYSAAAQ